MEHKLAVCALRCNDAMGAPDLCVLQVHHLQVALNEHGYYCGEDETVWWQFGMDTYSSLLTFQVGPLGQLLTVRLNRTASNATLIQWRPQAFVCLEVLRKHGDAKLGAGMPWTARDRCGR